MALLEVVGDLSALEEYGAGGLARIRSVRAMFAPFLSPIDKLRLELEEAWAPGIRLLQIGKHLAFVGLVRWIGPGGARAHVDRLGEVLGGNIGVMNLQAQLAANVYLSVPATGGELEIWAEQPNEEQLASIRCTNSAYAIEATELGEPVVRFKPALGELVLFNSTRVHRIAPSVDGVRMSMSCFIGFERPSRPLLVWS